jgi:hypothetical protein
MLKFDDASITLTPEKTFIIQLYVYGEQSGYPAETNYNACRRLFESLGDALAEYERRDRDERANVVEFKKHG